MKRIVLVSFADRRYRNAMKRLDIASANFPFTERHFCDETNTFDKKYWRKSVRNLAVDLRQFF